MIPKVIHYCWFGRNKKSKLIEKCIESWKKYCPDYKIIEWNEDNYDLSKTPVYVQQAYSAKKWAFVTDYVRLDVVYCNGGVYLDTDVELIKNLDSLLVYNGFFGYETDNQINTGLGFGGVARLQILKELMGDYNNCCFVVNDGSYDLTPCPQRNADVFIKNGVKPDGTNQLINNNVMIFSREYFCPIDYYTNRKHITDNTLSIHWFSSSWSDEKAQKYRKISSRMAYVFGRRNADIIFGIASSVKREGPGRYIVKRVRKYCVREKKDE